MADVFVSYKAEDRRRVRPLVEALQADGFSVWWDAQIGGGAEWREAIEQQLNAASCVVVVWSKRSIGRDGRFVRDEASRAQRRGIYLPALIDKVEPPLGFGETQAVPLIGWKGERSDPQYAALLTAVRSIVAGAPFHGYAGPAMRSALGRRAVVVGGTVAAAAAVAGGWILFRPTSATANSIAVLPFANLSGDPAQAYFSDGIAEELRSVLSRVTQLKVMARTSSEMVRSLDAVTAAKKLGAENIVVGSVRRSASTIRVSAQLIDGHRGVERWSRDYDRAAGDALQIQADIAAQVAQALSVQLLGEPESALKIGGTASEAARDFYLQALELFPRTDQPTVRRALQLLDQALAIDPNYALALADKARVLLYIATAFGGRRSEIEGGQRLAAATAQRAVEIAPALAAAHLSLAEVLRSALDVPNAFAAFRKAQRLARREAPVDRTSSRFLSRIGFASEALRLADSAISTDPLNPASYFTRMVALYCGRQYQDAVESARELTRRSPSLFSASAVLGSCLILLGRMDEARAELARSTTEDRFLLLNQAVLAVRTADDEAVRRTTTRLQQLYGDTARYELAAIAAQRGRIDEALAGLERAFASREPNVLAMRVEPFFDPLRREARFGALMGKMRYPTAA